MVRIAECLRCSNCAQKDSATTFKPRIMQQLVHARPLLASTSIQYNEASPDVLNSLNVNVLPRNAFSATPLQLEPYACPFASSALRMSTPLKANRPILPLWSSYGSRFTWPQADVSPAKTCGHCGGRPQEHVSRRGVQRYVPELAHV